MANSADGEDATTGKNEELTDLQEGPVELSYQEFAESRALEIEAISNAIKDGKRNKRASQKLPRHMRRRAMSHNIKRLPRRFHKQAEFEMSAYPPKPTSKRPSRKYRRRPRNLLAEYTRRQRKNVWLETHIWHAKRFKMTEMWGYKLPVHPNDKSIRASYRAVANHCLMVDLSYMCCIEICGEIRHLRTGFQHLMSDEVGPLVTDDMYLDGKVEGRALLYKTNKYPKHLVGPADFLWKPDDSSDDNHRTLWMWVHPSSYMEVIKELSKAFNIPVGNLDDSDTIDSVESNDNTCTKTSEDVVNEPPAKKLKTHAEVSSSTTTCLPEVNNLCLKNENVVITSLKDQLNRYRLFGPQSLTILADVMKTAFVKSDETTSSGKNWWVDYYSNDQHIQDHRKQAEDWLNFSQVGLTSGPAHKVWCLTVKDPRLDMPPTRTFLEGEETSECSDKSSDTSFSHVTSSPIWSKSIRDNVKNSKMTLHELNQRRSKLLVPGSKLELGDKESRIPVVMIHKQSAKCTADNHGYGCYIDVIIPAGWGLPFWLSFVYRGCRTGGLRELDTTMADSGAFVFPKHFPDSEAGRCFAEKYRSELTENLYRKPPAKRTPYNAMGILSPFHAPWKEIVSEWSGKDIDNESIIVSRSNNLLKLLDDLSENNDSCGESYKSLVKLQLNSPETLAPVALKMLNKGAPPEFSVVCLPTRDDLQALKRDKHYQGPSEDIDHNQVRDDYIKELKKKGKKTKPAIRELQKLKDIRNVKDCCSRTCIGYTVYGGYCFYQGSGAGLALCTLAGLVELLKNTKIVLVRSPTTRQYRFATVSIIK